ncbi:HAMP domain-containing protein [Thermoactinomyces sp. AMNI-1]|uniref:histidine kinase n=2 Tax=Thermoactinomyces mirandus TaxID=2756294 RepID=A0A7W1XTE6_9BACL|nr:ATP-binding protein [Thermoactinomyces mirandus]MBA4602895.1 HAMP domain-containing protein [Thermoactinomyces mirandus]
MKKWKQLVNSIQWKLVVIYLLLIIMAMQLIGVYFFRQLENHFTDSLNQNLRTQAEVLKKMGVAEELAKGQNDEERSRHLNTLLSKLAPSLQQSDMTIHIIDENNFIIASTEPNQSKLKKRPFTYSLPAQPTEVLKRTDPATGQDYQFYTEKLSSGNNYAGMIYIEAPLKQTYENIKEISVILVQITIVSLIITSLLVVILARTITSPVKEITEQATLMAAGDFNRKVSLRSEDEIGQLAHAFNHLAAHLRNALAEKEEEKEKLESVLANMSDGVIATDSLGQVIVKNEWAEKLLEHPVEIGETIDNILPSDTLIDLPLTRERQTYLELKPDDPETNTILKVTYTPIKLKEENMYGMVIVLEDVTEQKRLDQQRKDFVANVSHELRTPLTTIKSYLEALEDGAMDEPELARRFLKVTRQEADRMTRLIQDLLQLSHLDSRKITFHKQQISLEPLLQEVADHFSFQCKERCISLTLYTHSKLPQIFADRDKLHQVLDNLVSNAVKYTPDGGSIAIVAQTDTQGMVEVGIADTGIGIPKKDLGRIFERFYRVDKARSRSLGGTGLGLAIAQEIVHHHEGEIEIDSIYKKGTLVSFTLPPVTGGKKDE